MRIEQANVWGANWDFRLANALAGRSAAGDEHEQWARFQKCALGAPIPGPLFYPSELERLRNWASGRHLDADTPGSYADSP